MRACLGAARVPTWILLSLTGCATFGQPAKPVGEPGPLACISAKAADEAWRKVDEYMRSVLAAQVAYSCAPLAPASVPPVVPPVR